MSKRKPIIIGLVILIIAFVLVIFVKKEPVDSNSLSGLENTIETAISTNNRETEKVNIATSTGLSIKEKAWDVLQKYLGFAKSKNIEGVRSLSYQLTDSCKKYSNEEEKKDCDARMDTVAFFGIVFAKKDFIEVWSDSKQIILATDFRIEENEEVTSRTRSMIYFVVEDGVIKVLKFDPAKGSVLQKADLTKVEIDKRLVELTEDTDKDGAEDYLEKCISKSQDSTCIKTDITKRDTDGDGFWDGIEALFYK